MNKIQKMSWAQCSYIVNKSYLERTLAEMAKIEKKYISDNKIINLNGEPPAHIWTIDNAAVFEKACVFLESDEKVKEVEKKINTAKERLARSEEELLKIALEIIPKFYKKEKETLKKAVENNYTTRQKVIDLALRLDAKTIKI